MPKHRALRQALMQLGPGDLLPSRLQHFNNVWSFIDSSTAITSIQPRERPDRYSIDIQKMYNIFRQCLRPSLDAEEDTQAHADHSPDEKTQALAADLLSILMKAEKNDEHLADKLENAVQATGWYSSLAEVILNRLQQELEAKGPMGQAAREAYEKSLAEAKEFARKHPIAVNVLIALIALGILAIMMPWAIEALGFSELGPIEGKEML